MDILEGTCGYGKGGKLGETPAGPHLIDDADLIKTFFLFLPSIAATTKLLIPLPIIIESYFDITIFLGFF